MEPDEDAEDDGTDPLAVVARTIELVGMAFSLWYLWTIVRSDPDFKVMQARWSAKVRDWRQARRFARTDTVVGEAALILTEDA